MRVESVLSTMLWSLALRVSGLLVCFLTTGFCTGAAGGAAGVVVSPPPPPPPPEDGLLSSTNPDDASAWAILIGAAKQRSTVNKRNVVEGIVGFIRSLEQRWLVS